LSVSVQVATPHQATDFCNTATLWGFQKPFL
jgi:hypothetical protein